MHTVRLASYLSIREILRNKGRFILISLVIALITLLVLFIAALGEGLGNGNREYLSKLGANLIVYRARSDLVIGASRLERSQAPAIRRIDGVADAGPIGTSSTSIILTNRKKPLKVSLLGVDPGRTGEPKVMQGRQLSTGQAREVILDRSVTQQAAIKIGDTITIRVTQGTEDKYFDLKVVGISENLKYSLQPSIFVPFFTWDRVRPKSEAEVGRSDAISNVIAVSLKKGADLNRVKSKIEQDLTNVEVATIGEAIANVPGYSAQQSTINTQGAFTLLIGLLVIGGFFQIQALQKIPQIGVMKAIGSSNGVVGFSLVIQITIITIAGVMIGGLLAFLFSLTFPPSVPIVFNGTSTIFSIIALLLIGPAGGLVSVRYAIRIEPLKALGLSS